VRFDLRDLELFVAVADTGSIAKAAEASHTVPSAVSKRLSDLEASFSLSLLVRGARGVELTPAGHAFLLRARRMLHQAGQLEGELRAYASGLRGHVRVFANISSIVEFLPAALAGFLQSHPEVQVHLEEHVSSAIAQAVADNVADLGIISDIPAVEGLQLLPYRSDELILLTAADHPLGRRAEVALRETLGFPLVGLHANSSLHHLLAKAAAESNLPLTFRIQVTSFDAVCAMVAAGLGIGIVPRAVTTAYTASLNLRAVKLSDPWARRQLFLCVRQQEPLHPAAQMLLEYLQQGSSGS